MSRPDRAEAPNGRLVRHMFSGLLSALFIYLFYLFPCVFYCTILYSVLYFNLLTVEMFWPVIEKNVLLTTELNFVTLHLLTSFLPYLTTYLLTYFFT